MSLKLVNEIQLANMETKTTYKEIKSLAAVEKLSAILDSKFTIPFTSMRFGIDPIIGLVPVVGDVIGLALSSGIFFVILKNGVSRKVKILMALNIIVDAVLGAIPFVGSIFDFYYKANSRNIALLKKHYQEGKYQGSGNGIIFIILLSLAVVLAGVSYGLYKLVQWLYLLVA